MCVCVAFVAVFFLAISFFFAGGVLVCVCVEDMQTDTLSQKIHWQEPSQTDALGSSQFPWLLHAFQAGFCTSAKKKKKKSKKERKKAAFFLQS